jgi:hypothetical protein
MIRNPKKLSIILIAIIIIGVLMFVDFGKEDSRELSVNEPPSTPQYLVDYYQVLVEDSEEINIDGWVTYQEPHSLITVKHPSGEVNNELTDVYNDGGVRESTYVIQNFTYDGQSENAFYIDSVSEEMFGLSAFYSDWDRQSCAVTYEELQNSNYIVNLDKEPLNSQASFIVGVTDHGETYTRGVTACFDLQEGGSFVLIMGALEELNFVNHKVLRGIIKSVKIN